MKTHHILSLSGILLLALGLIGYAIGSDALALFSLAAALPFFLPALVAQQRTAPRGVAPLKPSIILG